MEDNTNQTSYWQENGKYFQSGYDLFQLSTSRYVNMLAWFLKETSESENIFEAGAGTGNLTKELLDRGKTVFAVDINKNALEILEEKCKNINENLSVSQAEIGKDNLKIPQNYFDIATSMIVLPFPQNIQNYLLEIYNSLKENGKFILASWAYKEDIFEGVIKTMQNELEQKGIIERYPQMWETMHEEGIRSANAVLSKKLSLEKLIFNLEKTGFKNIQTHGSPYDNQYSYQLTCLK